MTQPSVVGQGAQEAARYDAEEVARKERWREENRKHTIHRFYMDFYAHHYKANPEYKGYGSEPRYIHEPPLPEVTEWETTGPGDSRAPSTFVCEGLRYEVWWKDEGRGGDRAYWDDGYWPQWSLVLKRRWLPFLKRRVLVYGPANVTQALA